MSEKEQISQVVKAGKPKSELSQVLQGLAVLDTVVLCIFHLLAASPFLTLNNTEQAMTHGALVVTFFLLVRHLKFKGGKLIDIGLIAITIAAAYQVIVTRNSNSASTVLHSQLQQMISITFVIVALSVGYRALGKILSTLRALFLAYTLLGRYLPGAWATACVTVIRMSTYLMVSSEGLFGDALSMAANFIFLFVIFGSVLSLIGAGESFVKITFAVLGKVCGGPAQAAVYSSMLMGTANGSGVANVMTTGTFTIPLTKQTGLDRDTVGAIEAVASNDGQTTPPVTGAVALLMTDATSLPYTVICLVALLPVVFHYTALSTPIAAYPHRNRVPVREPDPNAEIMRQIFKSGWFRFLSTSVLVGLMAKGFSAQRAALITIILCLVIGLSIDRKKFTVKNLIDLRVQSAKLIMAVSIACMIVGVIMGSINITGLGLKISELIMTVVGGRIFIMGILTVIMCTVLGMGLPTSAYYIVLAALAVPAMIDPGVATISVHMFVLHYGVVVTTTPSVALAVFAAVGISGGDMQRIRFQAMKTAIFGLVIPFISLYNMDLLMFNSATGTFGFTPTVALSFATTALGRMIMALVLFGWLSRDFNRIEQVILLVYVVFLVLNGPSVLNGVGSVTAMAVLFGAKVTAKKKEVVV